MIDHVRNHVLPAAFDVLPAAWRTLEAEAMLLAIGLQESRFTFRRQIGGPARGFWQFELGGVKGIMQHAATMQPIADALEALRFGTLRPEELHAVLETNDTLAAVCARCLLYTLPKEMPARDQPRLGWNLYIDGWRPGRPHLDTWVGNFVDAWGTLNT